jgi:hypothetical protein
MRLAEEFVITTGYLQSPQRFRKLIACGPAKNRNQRIQSTIKLYWQDTNPVTIEITAIEDRFWLSQ